MAYVIKRKYKSGSDYLHAWCDEWGTSCMGSIKLAMVFDSKQAVDAAVIKAQTECRGVDGPAVGIKFEAVEI